MWRLVKIVASYSAPDSEALLAADNFEDFFKEADTSANSSTV